jgi:hypothetical protein
VSPVGPALFPNARARALAVHHRALMGKPALLKSLFSPTSRWEGMPLLEKGGDLQEALDMIDQARSFLIEPCLAVYNVTVDRQTNTVIMATPGGKLADHTALTKPLARLA